MIPHLETKLDPLISFFYTEGVRPSYRRDDIYGVRCKYATRLRMSDKSDKINRVPTLQIFNIFDGKTKSKRKMMPQKKVSLGTATLRKHRKIGKRA
jgi:hypothetical protein